MAFLEIDQISHDYFTKETATNAIKGVSLNIDEGEFISFLGPSGCGKTTLLSIIAGLLAPTTGKVALKGKKITEPDTQIGYMLQQDYLFPWKTIEENTLLGLRLTKQLNSDNKEYTLALLDQMGLLDVKDSYPSQLSGGMRQRVALVRTLATKPELLLLDEPFSALDYQTKLKLEDLVFETLKNHKKTALLVTHDIGEAIAMSDRIVLFSTRPGKIQRVFDVSESLRSIKPFQARNDSDFSILFQTIWKELNELENKSSQ
ncbi:ABC transporter ATP-binding protein [Pseudalkalibacillus caeni]|uniref:ABC transporter ATP-binding protein n=1 Tax=Exobacillus caeni TaxID=2574798 RepID=A0A5R9FDS0_9BACL|nr:ABC transporter ATP-binding protein [Pseudalkalibacillus caeni]TLS39023.1 ABC transporter ATP-binding protein [Pseudalkalibacillus caeni]